MVENMRNESKCNSKKYSNNLQEERENKTEKQKMATKNKKEK